MKIFKKIILSIFIIGVMVVTPSIVTPTFLSGYTVEAASVKLNKTKYTMIEGQTYTLKIKGTSKKVKWYTSNKKIATVSSKGKVTAKKKGTVTITAKVGSKKYKCKITVEQPKISKTKKTITTGSTYTLKMSGTKQKVTWSSSDTKIATVSSKGKVTAKKKGTVTITAKVGSKKYKCKITVKNVPSLNKTKLTLEQGKTYTLKLSGTSSTPTWKTSNKSIVSISKKSKYEYKIKANKAGTAYIKVKVDGKELSCKIKVNAKVSNTVNNTSSSTSNNTSNSTSSSTSNNTSNSTSSSISNNTSNTSKDNITIQLENPPVNSFCFDSYGNAYVVTSTDGKYKLFGESLLNPNMKKKPIGKYKNVLKDEEAEYYTLESGSVFSRYTYLFYVTDTGYIRSTDGIFNSVGDDYKYIDFKCYDIKDTEIEINETDIKWEISNPDVVRIEYWQQSYYQITPLKPGSATIKATFRDVTTTYAINIGESEQTSEYTYTIKDISTSETWYAGYGGRLLYIETNNPDIDSFEIVPRGINCDMDSAVMADVVYEDRHFSNWSSNAFTDKKNYYKAKDGKGYYVKIDTDEVGKVNLYIKEGTNTLTSTRLTLESISGGKEKYQQWLQYVEEQSITPEMTTLEKIDAVSTWLRENCYYPTCVYKDGEFFHEEYPDAPIWEVPTFDCLMGVQILASIVKKYDGVEKVTWDGYLFAEGGSHLAIVTVNGNIYEFNSCPYKRIVEDIYL